MLRQKLEKLPEGNEAGSGRKENHGSANVSHRETAAQPDRRQKDRLSASKDGLHSLNFGVWLMKRMGFW